MTIREKYKCTREAMGLTQKDFAIIAGVDEDIYAAFEDDKYVPHYYYRIIPSNIEGYLTNLPKAQYLEIRIKQELLMYTQEKPEEHVHTLSHLMIHVSKLNMLWVNYMEESQK